MKLSYYHEKQIHIRQRYFLVTKFKQARPNDVWTSVACSYFIWHKKLRLLVDLRIFSKFQGA